MVIEAVQTILTALAAFVATSVDDLLVLLVLFGQARNATDVRAVALGQYLGFALNVALSLLGYVGRLVVPVRWLGLLGLLPIALGIHTLVAGGDGDGFQLRGAADGEGTLRGGVWRNRLTWTAAVLALPDGDNLGVYAPLFATLDARRLAGTVLTLLLLGAGLVYAGYRAARHPAVVGQLERYGRAVVPYLLMALGFYILWESGLLPVLGR
jgi:cadmium resistance protein CadD (predicted permease)